MTVLSPNWLPNGWPERASARSILSGAYPYGMSYGGARESLGSFMNRVCNAQDVGRWTMTHRVLGPLARNLMGVEPMRMARDVGRADYMATLSGISDVALEWAEVLNRATLRNDLQMCTLLPLRGLVPSLKLQATARRHCPYCLDGDVRDGRESYMRLLWLLAPVKACPLHGVNLMEEPWKSEPHNKNNSSRRRSARESLPCTSMATAASGFDVEISRIIADLLEDATVFAGLQLEKSAQSVFLEYAADSLFNGKRAHLARHLGVNKSLLHAWVKGTASISLHRLALIAYCCNCAIADVLLGNKVRLSLRARPSDEPDTLLNRRNYVGRKSDAEIKDAMQRALRSGQALAGYQMADELLTSPKYLRMNFPEEYAAVVAAGQEKRKHDLDERKRRFTEEYCRAHSVVASTGEYPSRRRVIANMRTRSCKRGSWWDYHAAQREAHARYGTAVRRKHNWTARASPVTEGNTGISPDRDFL
ncbi:MAG: TniQ family protein [Trinickia sp.]|uniref:TniQ family protein n=1 Tax=Trinickia sp. TaxID=2571163 RepID=UPI003F7E62B8